MNKQKIIDDEYNRIMKVISLNSKYGFIGMFKGISLFHDDKKEAVIAAYHAGLKGGKR